MYHYKIHIIIVNWNGKDDTLECIESIRQIDYPNFITVVVDNGSTDDSVRSIQTRFPEVTILETGENLGFAGGNNIGIRYALKNGADFILLLNNDTTVDNQLLKNFMSATQSIQQRGIFSAKIYYYSQPNRIWYAGARWVNETKRFITVGKDCIDNGIDFNSITETDYAHGCSLFAKAEVFDKVGLLDEQYFLTFEETDFCYRARKAGYRCFFVPEAKVWHKVSVSFGGEGSPLFHYFQSRNRLLWAEKNLSGHSRLILYKNVFIEILKYILPPRFHLNSSEDNLSLRGIYRSSVEYRNSFNKKLNNPFRKARLWGVRDYCLRRFGNCPEAVRLLGK